MHKGTRVLNEERPTYRRSLLVTYNLGLTQFLLFRLVQLGRSNRFHPNFLNNLRSFNNIIMSHVLNFRRLFIIILRALSPHVHLHLHRTRPSRYTATRFRTQMVNFPRHFYTRVSRAIGILAIAHPHSSFRIQMRLIRRFDNFSVNIQVINNSSRVFHFLGLHHARSFQTRQITMGRQRATRTTQRFGNFRQNIRHRRLSILHTRSPHSSLTRPTRANGRRAQHINISFTRFLQRRRKLRFQQVRPHTRRRRRQHRHRQRNSNRRRRIMRA